MMLDVPYISQRGSADCAISCLQMALACMPREATMAPGTKKQRDCGKVDVARRSDGTRTRIDAVTRPPDA